MIWRFNDGTTMHLGGRVEGPSPFAAELRAALADSPRVALYPLPCESIALDVHNAANLNRWLLDRLCVPRWRRAGLVALEQPENLPPLPERPSDDDAARLDDVH